MIPPFDLSAIAQGVAGAGEGELLDLAARYRRLGGVGGPIPDASVLSGQAPQYDPERAAAEKKNPLKPVRTALKAIKVATPGHVLGDTHGEFAPYGVYGGVTGDVLDDAVRRTVAHPTSHALGRQYSHQRMPSRQVIPESSGTVDPGREARTGIDAVFNYDADGREKVSEELRRRVEVMVLDDDNRVLVGRKPSGELVFPGGGVDEHSVDRAARREAAEETGYYLKDVRTIGERPTKQLWPEDVKEKQSKKPGRDGTVYDGGLTYWRMARPGDSGHPAHGSEGDKLPNLGFMSADRVLTHLRNRAKDDSNTWQHSDAARVRALETAIERRAAKAAALQGPAPSYGRVLRGHQPGLEPKTSSVAVLDVLRRAGNRLVGPAHTTRAMSALHDLAASPRTHDLVSGLVNDAALFGDLGNPAALKNVLKGPAALPHTLVNQGTYTYVDAALNEGVRALDALGDRTYPKLVEYGLVPRATAGRKAAESIDVVAQSPSEMFRSGAPEIDDGQRFRTPPQPENNKYTVDQVMRDIDNTQQLDSPPPELFAGKIGPPGVGV